MSDDLLVRPQHLTAEPAPESVNLNCQTCGEAGELNRGEDSGYPQFWVACWREGVICCATQRQPTQIEAEQSWVELHQIAGKV